MRAIAKYSNKKTGFTIVELLTVMSIIVILISLLVPSLSMVRQYARRVRQEAQFHSIETSLELYHSQWESYPPSNYETTPDGYCGAMKFAEAMLGQDLLGLHPSSLYRSDGMNSALSSPQLYPSNPPEENIKSRKGPYLQLENANAHRLRDLFPPGPLTWPFDPNSLVLCDVYTRVKNLGSTGKSKIGMPILYYSADTSKTKHNLSNPDDKDNIYNYKDNHTLLELGMPWNPPPAPDSIHKLYEDLAAGEPAGYRFYKNTKDYKITTVSRPQRVDSYILMSAGFDGEYGTPDDIYNFEWSYKE